MADANYVNQWTMIANSGIANLLSGRRQALSEAQEQRLGQDLSLRERQYQAQQRQWDQDYQLRQQQIGLQEKQHELNSRFQGAQIRAFDIKANDVEAETFAAPYVAKITQDINNLMGDPDAISKFTPDFSFIDDAPEQLRPAIRAKVSLATQSYRDQALAASDENKYVSETGKTLLQGAPYLTSDKYGPRASMKAQQLGRALLRRQPLSEEDQILVSDFSEKIQQEAAKRSPKLMETRYRLQADSAVENLKAATVQYQEASKTYRDTLNNLTATPQAKEAAKEELDLAKEILGNAKAMAGIRPQAVAPRVQDNESQIEDQTMQTPENGTNAVVAPATKAPSIKDILPPVTPIQYPPRPSQRQKSTNSVITPKGWAPEEG
jgi:hypothetical protein